MRRALAVVIGIFFGVLAAATIASLVATLDVIVGFLGQDSAVVTGALVREADERKALPAPEPLLLRPLCPDQWIAQRGAGERWRTVCVTASTEGSRTTQ